jgi:hypothetical protein
VNAIAKNSVGKRGLIELSRPKNGSDPTNISDQPDRCDSEMSFLSFHVTNDEALHKMRAEAPRSVTEGNALNRGRLCNGQIFR